MLISFKCMVEMFECPTHNWTFSDPGVRAEAVDVDADSGPVIHQHPVDTVGCDRLAGAAGSLLTGQNSDAAAKLC